jgi:hypothetical protein
MIATLLWVLFIAYALLTVIGIVLDIKRKIENERKEY